MLVRLQKILFFLILFCLSFQVGYHFWPDFAYIHGVRVDYLSPTLHLLDILIVAFILTSFPIIIKQKNKLPRDKILFSLLILFLLSLIVNLFNSVSIGAHLFGLVRFGELFLFSFCVARTFSIKEIRTYINILCITAVISSLIAIAQFYNQGSAGGILYFLGERSFSLSTIGISTVNLGQQLLRPYAAFPHPNVLGFFLLMVIVFSAPFIFAEKEKLRKIFLIFAVCVSQVALVLTFSRVNILLSLIFFIYLFALMAKRKMLFYFLGSIAILILIVILIFPQIVSQEFLFRGIDFRQELFTQSLLIFQSSPVFGVGVNNFFINQEPLIINVSPTNYQPPHNIFILWLLQFGVIGFLILPYGFYLAFKSVIKKLKSKNQDQARLNQSLLFLLISVIIAGIFDHYFLTLEQGLIMFALILGLAFSPISSKNVTAPKKSQV